MSIGCQFATSGGYRFHSLGKEMKQTGQCFPYKQEGPHPNLALEVRWCPYGISILVRATEASPVETAGPEIVLPSARYEAALFY